MSQDKRGKDIGKKIPTHKYLYFLANVRISCSVRRKVLWRSVKNLAAAAASMFLYGSDYFFKMK